MIKIRKSQDRGFANHGWLKSYHSFSFAQYYDSSHIHFGNLRVINEDFIAPMTGFPSHPHQNMEIITYIKKGSIEHKDSIGNHSIIKEGEIQVMSAGSGVVHSEYNTSQNETHLFQIWILPKTKNTTPTYQQKTTINNANNSLILAVSETGENDSLKINQNCKIYLGRFRKNKTLKMEKCNKLWLQLIDGTIEANGNTINSGDAICSNEEEMSIAILSDAEFILFEL